MAVASGASGRLGVKQGDGRSHSVQVRQACTLWFRTGSFVAAVAVVVAVAASGARSVSSGIRDSTIDACDGAEKGRRTAVGTHGDLYNASLSLPRRATSATSGLEVHSLNG